MMTDDTTSAIGIHTALASAAASYDPYAPLAKLKRDGDPSGVVIGVDTSLGLDGTGIVVARMDRGGTVTVEDMESGSFTEKELRAKLDELHERWQGEGADEI